MKSGYKIFWTDHALIELKETFNLIGQKQNAFRLP